MDIKKRVKVKFSPNKSWRLGWCVCVCFILTLTFGTQLWRQSCQLHAPAACTLPPMKFLAIHFCHRPTGRQGCWILSIFQYIIKLYCSQNIANELWETLEWNVLSNIGGDIYIYTHTHEDWNFNFGNTPLDWIQELLEWRANAAGRMGPSPAYIRNGSGPSRNGHTQ